MRVRIATRDLFFRAKLEAVVRGAGAAVAASDGECDLVVLEVGAAGVDARIRALVAQGIPVLAFGSHLGAEALRAAREAGARAVPNSQVERALAERLQQSP